MPNLHGTPDTLAEVMAREGDQLPPVILSTSWPTVPVSSMTLAPFATRGYCRDGTTPPRLTYVAQAAAGVTLVGANGTYWLCLYKDTSSGVSGWTRQAGTHYLWLSQPTQPGDPPGGLVFASATVAGGVITAVTVVGPVAGISAAWRAHLGLGSIAGYEYVEGVAALGCTGFAAPEPTGTLVYTLVGNLVTFTLPDLSGTSNHESFGIFGLPAALSSPRAIRVAVMVQDNGVFKSGYVQLNGTSLSVFPDAAFGPFVASGTKASYGGMFVYRTT